MSSSEDQELIEKIRNLSGQINRHKAQQGVPPNYPSRGSYQRSAPYPQSSYRGGRGKYGPVHRNRTLVLNGQSQSTATPTTEKGASDSAASSFVSRTDRHLQLINTSVYEKDSQHRANAMEKSLRYKHLKDSHREKLQFMKTMRPRESPKAGIPATTPAIPTFHEINVEGVRYQVINQGSKLVRFPGDMNPPSATPKVTSIGGVVFHRTKNGNLVRHGIVKAQRLAGGIKKVDQLCEAFSSTGKCPKGPTCRYVHDASKTAMCKFWLLKGECADGDNCDLSHDIKEERVPLCLHFANGRCNNSSCSYIHVEHSKSDPVCRNFGVYGYCDKGAKCPDRHVFECPDFSNTGVCRLKGCKRPHIERASVLRKASTRQSSAEMDDLSSDEEDNAADSDDVDSDEIEEFVGQDADDLDFAEQKDFIGFR
ncbi:hypothetical protein F5Y15DRAFT_367193 [Xylariaceae sp. FL0016]|nr:hypothetical protein F5Y15DRAFT_367193 [Xylariaceae sp. FL0016]